MKILKYLLSTIIIIGSIIACSSDDDNFNIDNIAAPTNVSAAVTVTQDNTGLVTIIPLGEGVVNFNILFGDDSEPSGAIQPGQRVNHIYEEGSYELTIIANGLNGLSTTITQPLVVSFQAPQNLVVTIENDAAISKRVNVTATADFALFYEVTFGEPGNDEPVTANIGDTASYTYQEAGTYIITVTAYSAAIENATYTEEFEVTAILQPLSSAPNPPFRAETDVISVFSNAYTNVSGTDFYPNWGQSTTYTQIVVGGSDIIQYGNLNYQGIQLGAPIDASAMEFLHIDVWTADGNDARISPISSGPNETAYDLDLNQDQWTSFDIPLSFFTNQNPLVNLADIIQFKFDGNPAGGTIFVDNLYFYRPASNAPSIVGTWKIANEPGSLGVGPNPGDMSWWNCDAGCIAERACYYDDTYVFAENGTFTNVLGDSTWIEGWQGGSDSCGTPVAPYDGTASATYTYNSNAGTVTINGAGAYIGLPKANNQGELPNVPVPSSITYNIAFIDTNTLSVSIDIGGGVFWQYRLVREGEVSPLQGTWYIANEPGSLGVGPNPGDMSWWNCDAGCIAERACYYDDAYVFSADGTFTNVLGDSTWVEGWQGGSESCDTPVAPHDGTAAATYAYDANAGTVTINGAGAYIGIPKANNQGELPNVPVPNSIVYDITFTDSNTVNVSIDIGGGVFWQYKLVRL